MVNLTLPNMTFNMNRIYPFRGKKSDGKYNWLENIQISYNSKLENKISAPDSTFFTQQTLNNMKNGFSHSIPISLANIKLLKFINITPVISYNGVLYTSYLNKEACPDTSIYIRTRLSSIPFRKLPMPMPVSASLGISASPKIYGMYHVHQSQFPYYCGPACDDTDCFFQLYTRYVRYHARLLPEGSLPEYHHPARHNTRNIRFMKDIFMEHPLSMAEADRFH